jgi:acetate kinase
MIFCLNSGSSSLKFSAYRIDTRETRLVSGAIEGLTAPDSLLWARGADGGMLVDQPRRRFADTREAVAAAFGVLGEIDLPPPGAVGHRVVFGGSGHVAPERIDPALLETLRAARRFAPLHMPAELAAIEAALAAAPDIPHIACYDTAFHAALPAVARRLPLPRELHDEGVQRFGYHGLSYEYVVSRLGASLGRAVIAHLGHGVSLAAVRDGGPVDTTMGFSPAGGVPMSTRSGDLDPGVFVYLAREKGLDADAFERLVTRQSGLLGLSGTTGDMQELLDRRAADPRAAAAVELFCYQIRRQIGALTAALGGLDVLVFTGGIGERAAPIRLEVCRGLEHLGVRIDAGLNERHAPIISHDGDTCTVRVEPTDENLVIARHTHALTKGHP